MVLGAKKYEQYDLTCNGTINNPFLAKLPILYFLKTPENFWFSGVFREGIKRKDWLEKS